MGPAGGGGPGPEEPLLATPLTANDDTLLPLIPAADARAAALLPLQVRGRWVGLVAISWPAERHFESHDRQLDKSMASRLAVSALSTNTLGTRTI